MVTLQNNYDNMKCAVIKLPYVDYIRTLDRSL